MVMCHELSVMESMNIIIGHCAAGIVVSVTLVTAYIQCYALYCTQ